MALIVLKGLLAEDESRSVVRSSSAFVAIGLSSKSFAFKWQADESFDALLLGHRDLALDQGPLTVAALGVNPPERSIHFHVSLLSKTDETVSSAAKAPSAEESKSLVEQLKRLSTKNLTVVIGAGVDHGLVSEQRMETLTTRPSALIANGIRASLPEGDGEGELRRLIDDSVNLLSEQEFNARRIDLGIAPINLAWPWGQGERPKVTNQALALGRPWRVVGNSLALRGLARLSGFRTEPLGGSFRDAIVSATKEPATLMVFDFSSFDPEEMEKTVADLSEQFLTPLIDWQRDQKSPLTMVATNRSGHGIVATFAGGNERDHFPFDERAFTEKRVEWIQLAQLLDRDV